MQKECLCRASGNTLVERPKERNSWQIILADTNPWLTESNPQGEPSELGLLESFLAEDGDSQPPVVKSAHVVETTSGASSSASSSADSDQATADGTDTAFVPLEPKTLEEAGLAAGEIEALALKYLLNCGTATGRQVSDQLHLPHALVRESLDQLKSEMLVTYKASAGLGDFVFQLTDSGIDRAHRHAERCTYYGAAPVAFGDYIESVKQQSLRAHRPRIVDLCQAFGDLTLGAEMISQLAQAISAGRGLFLYGSPGNGKTSIAERITLAFGQDIWIPRTLGLTGEMIRLYDPSNHQQVSTEAFKHLKFDRRWVLIRRPTIIVGGELMLEHLDIQFNPATGINEAPVHMKSNCGTLVIDDFGRQRVGTADLLNRWIVPLEKQIDFLNLASGRQVEIPFEQLLGPVHEPGTPRFSGRSVSSTDSIQDSSQRPKRRRIPPDLPAIGRHDGDSMGRIGSRLFARNPFQSRRDDRSAIVTLAICCCRCKTFVGRTSVPSK